MLTILFPDVLQSIGDFAGGLMPFRVEGNDQLSLIVKTQKEAILAAKINGGFSFYLPVLPSTTTRTTALIAAFFDDADQPLIIRSPLFDDDQFSRDIIEILSYDEVNIYFFDEQNYEWMSFKTVLQDGGSCLKSDEKIALLSYHPKTIESVHQALISWFGCRTPHDDDCSIKAIFKDPLGPDDILVLDTTSEVNGYLGSSGYRRDSLTRPEPGYFQERDISTCLLRSFGSPQIMMNPRRKDTFKEVLDHLVLTDELAILIQAKDSPTTEAGIGRALERKHLSTHSQIDNAINQINGAARFFAREPIAKLVVGGRDVEVSIGQRRMLGLVIVKELFDDEGTKYSAACSKLSGLSGGGAIMDYNSFHAFTHHFNSEVRFVHAMEALIHRVRASGWIGAKDIVLDDIIRNGNFGVA